MLLTACGSSTTESALKPARLIVFGDAFSDVGQAGVRYTVNDGTTNNWLQQVAAEYGVPITASDSGGFGYARNGARIKEKPNLLGSADAQTVTEQAAAFLSAGNVYGSNDLVFVNGGMSDVIVQAKAFLAGSQTQDQMVANARQAGTDLGAVVRSVVASGAKYVAVAGTINVGITPWAQATGQASAIEEASLAFVTALKISVVDLGSNVLILEADYYFNQAQREPRNFSMNNSAQVACTSTDAGVGIGIGAGEVNSALCTTSTIASGVTYNSYMFADKLYTTPNLQRLFGTYIYGKLTNRW
ncbi:SGNH/GDSL hydrolase family protein [Pseudorhodoferax sp. Leaf274]|uniref:SGNH/GDSL hydrolase family protein n=1 Tax=Pseudorhodoferax sp. Leaf274 TaxID=1736318 RepID=UPI001F3F3D2D|nr:SGNH/GDSL hydrolase family protein [Pseudorhodoferax sp. Leaf274]